MDPSPHLWFLHVKQRLLDPNRKSLLCPRHHLLFCACNAVLLVPELHVSMGSSPSLWFLHSNQRLLEENYKSVWDPDITCRFVHSNLRD